MVPVRLFVVLLSPAFEETQLISIQLELCVSASLDVAHAYAVDVLWRSMALSALDNSLAGNAANPIPPDRDLSAGSGCLTSSSTETNTTKTLPTATSCPIFAKKIGAAFRGMKQARLRNGLRYACASQPCTALLAHHWRNKA